jgi:hypothetical protein
VSQIVRGQRPAQAVVCEIDPFAKSGAVVYCLGISVCGQESDVSRFPLNTDLQGVVVGIGDVHRVTIAVPECGAERVTRAQDLRAIRERKGRRLQVRPARRGCPHLIQFEAEVRVAGVGVVLRDQPVTLRADVGKRENSGSREFPLDREIVVLRVGQPVVDGIPGRIGDRQVSGVVEGLVCRVAGGREMEGETLSLRTSVRTRLERLIEHGRHRAHPIQAEGRVADFVEQVQVFNGCVV